MEEPCERELAISGFDHYIGTASSLAVDFLATDTKFEMASEREMHMG